MATGQDSIMVSASGAAESTPDRASADVGVSVLAKSVAKASQAVASAIADVLAAVDDLGVDRSAMRTIAHSVRPEYDHSGKTRRLAGYRVSNVVKIAVDSVDLVGPVIDAAAAAGGDVVTVDRIQFELVDVDELERLAREEAWNKAVAKAQQLASLAGRTLGAATKIEEVPGRRAEPVVPHRAAAMAAPAETPIEGGTISVSVTLTVSFGLT